MYHGIKGKPNTTNNNLAAEEVTASEIGSKRGLDVSVEQSALPSGAATSANQVTANASLANIEEAVPQFIVDANNSSTSDIPNADTFTGIWTEGGPVIVVSPILGGTATIQVQYSHDGVNTAYSDAGWSYDSEGSVSEIPRRFTVPTRYYRVLVTNTSGSLMTDVSIQTMVGHIPQLASELSDQLPSDYQVPVSRAIVSARDRADSLLPKQISASAGHGNRMAMDTDISLTSGLGDAFGRMRVSEPQTLFDSKQIHDNQALFWDEAEVSGSGTSGSHSANRASTTLTVGATTAGKRVRQTYQRFNYEPGKSQLIFMTGRLTTAGSGTAGITSEIGYFDDSNGLFFRLDGTTLSVVRRSNVSGTPVDTVVTRDNWNIDKLDGTGPSGFNLFLSTTQIMVIDFEWLGVGSVRFGFVINGCIIYCHQLNNANNLGSVYMSTPNLPIRYSIENDGTAASRSMEVICSSVASEGGTNGLGSLRYRSTEGTHINADTANTVYACVGIRLKTTHLGSSIKIEQLSMVCATTDDFEWLLILNPTVAGTFTYSDETNSSCQTAIGATANTVTGGTTIQGGFIKASGNTGDINVDARNAVALGSAIDGTRDEVVLCVRPLANGADIDAGLGWRELS